MRVASVPRRHVYTRHLGVESDGVQRIATPDEHYDPAEMMSARWVESNVDRFDCFHTHFGFGQIDHQELRQWRDALIRAGKPHVHTVHDLANPHMSDQHHHDEQLNRLIPAADAVLTLTPQAAQEIERRWDRPVTVVPHPHVLPLERVGADRSPHDRFVVGLHLKDLRSAIVGSEAVTAAVAAVHALVDIELLIHVYPRAFGRSPRRDAGVRRILDQVSRHPRISIDAEPYFSDADFADYLRRIDVAVLPYRHGTHSGWAEACLDAGTEVIAPSHTCIPDQHPRVRSITLDHGRLRVEDLVAALGEARKVSAVPSGITRTYRTRQREEISHAHASVYAEVTGR